MVKKPVMKAPKKETKQPRNVSARPLTMAELFAAVHNQKLEQQQNVRNLEHHATNFNQRFANRTGMQKGPSPRTVHHERGK